MWGEETPLTILNAPRKVRVLRGNNVTFSVAVIPQTIRHALLTDIMKSRSSTSIVSGFSSSRSFDL